MSQTHVLFDKYRKTLSGKVYSLAKLNREQQMRSYLMSHYLGHCSCSFITHRLPEKTSDWMNNLMGCWDQKNIQNEREMEGVTAQLFSHSLLPRHIAKREERFLNKKNQGNWRQPIGQLSHGRDTGRLLIQTRQKCCETNLALLKTWRKIWVIK